MDRPLKKYRSGAVEAAVWLNAKDIDGTRVEFKTVTLKRSWRDKESGDWKDERINIRRTDIPKFLVILSEVQKDLFLDMEGQQSGQGKDN
jgi:hypothetical protein